MQTRSINIHKTLKRTKTRLSVMIFMRREQILGLLAFVLCGLLIFSLNVLLEYKSYKEFLFTPSFRGQIIKQFEKTKKNRTYTVAHIQTHGRIIYTTFFKPPSSNHIEFKVVKANIKFMDYLRGRFYAPIYRISELEPLPLDRIERYIYDQHEHSKIKQFYGALFLAKPISSELRADINHYGIAHLLAISGYHMGLIYGVLFFALKHAYRALQRRFFPWRCMEFDLGVIIFSLIGLYFYEIGFVPSFLRSFVMGLLGFYLLCCGVKLVNFMHLFLAFLICVSLFPSLIFSVGFFFSCLGVFYIFLYARHFLQRSFWSVVGFEVWTFFAMVLPVLYFFPFFSLQQLLAIVITPLFVVFYPLSIVLHICGFGGLLDGWLLAFLDFKLASGEIIVPAWAFALYMIMSFVAIWSKRLAVALVSANGLLFVWFFVRDYIF